MSPMPVCLAAMVCLLSAPMLSAQGAPAAPASANAAENCVAVKDVKFAQAKFNGPYAWNRIEVVVDPRGLNPDPKAPNKRWIDKVKVTLTIGYKGEKSKSAEDWNYYRASATILTLEQNNIRSVFFYLPGDVVKRDMLRKDPDVYYVDLEVAGTTQAVFDARGLLIPEQKGSVSKELLKKADYDGCKGFADRGVLNTVGILRPQYLVGFYDDLWKFSPEFVREDAASR
ncbi:MAG: hypothetical protein ACO23N_00120 [Opitutales bacterium]|jgi:hypothetical protein